MTITERIQLHRLGYSKDEINQLAKDNYDPTALIEGTDNEVEQAVVIGEPVERSENSEILNAINNLTAAIQAQNLQRAEQNTPPKETTNDILKTLLNNT